MKERVLVVWVALVFLGLVAAGCASDSCDDGCGGAAASGAGATAAGTGSATAGMASAAGTAAATAAGSGSAMAAGSAGAGSGNATAGTGMGSAAGTTAGTATNTGSTAAGTGAAMAGMGSTAAGTGAAMAGAGSAAAGSAAAGSAAAGMSSAMAGTDSSGGMGGGMASGTCLQGSGDFSEDGPYDVSMSEVTIGDRGDFTLYVPTPLEENCPHPMVAWGNGTTVPGGTAYRHFNGRMASWGIVVIVSHDDGTADSGPRIGDGSFHEAGIDYLLEQNEDPSSMFYGKLSGRAGVSGHSQGGAGGDRASTHPNVEANGNVQGSFGRAPEGVAFLCLTGTEDIATEGCLSSVNGTSSPAFYASYDGMSHTATLSSRSAGSQQYARLLSAWFRCFLADDTAACEMFMGGENCPLCQEPGWDNIFAANY